jgi:hypothetical protein
MGKKENKKVELKLKDNEVLMPNGELTIIKPVKIRYMTGNKDFLGYQAIEQIGIVEIFDFGDGYDVVKRFLVSVFDDEEYVNSIIDDIDVGTLENILKTSKVVNKIKDEDSKNVLEILKEV